MKSIAVFWRFWRQNETVVQRQGVRSLSRPAPLQIIHGFDDHLTTILSEECGKSRKFAETKMLWKPNVQRRFRCFSAFFVEPAFSRKSLRM